MVSGDNFVVDAAAKERGNPKFLSLMVSPRHHGAVLASSSSSQAAKY
jgi:hypothetical protein